MANRSVTPDVEGETRFGPQRPGITGILGVDSLAGNFSMLYLNDVNGDTHYLWFSSDGSLRTDTSIPANPEADGTVIGP